MTETLAKEIVTDPLVDRLTYEKPVVIKEARMTFPLDIINSRGGERLVCKQCSSCHGCR